MTLSDSVDDMLLSTCIDLLGIDILPKVFLGDFATLQYGFLVPYLVGIDDVVAHL